MEHIITTDDISVIPHSLNEDFIMSILPKEDVERKLDSIKRKVRQKKKEVVAEIQEHKKHVTKMVVLGVIAIGALVVVAGKFFA